GRLGQLHRMRSRQVRRGGYEPVERPPQALLAALVVRHREGDEDPAVVAQADVDPLVLAQPVRRLVAADAEALELDENLEPIEVVRRLSTDQLVLEHVETVEPVEVAA